MYAKALNDCFGWWAEQGRPPFQRAVVHAHRNWLEAKGYSPSTINERLAAIRKLAEEAAANGWLAQEIAVGITTIPASSNKEPGRELAHQAQAEQLLLAPDSTTRKGKRDRVMIALSVGCGLRRGEAARLTIEDIQQRDGRWVLVDLRGKHGRIRTVPMPAWVKQAVDS
jgi:site-specific recombinase XerD